MTSQQNTLRAVSEYMETNRATAHHLFHYLNSLERQFLLRSELLDAFKALSKERATRCQLTLLGKGPQEQQLHEMVETLGISDRVHFAGEVSDVQAYLAKSDIFCLPSRAEGISNSLLEAIKVLLLVW